MWCPCGSCSFSADCRVSSAAECQPAAAALAEHADECGSRPVLPPAEAASTATHTGCIVAPAAQPAVNGTQVWTGQPRLGAKEQLLFFSIVCTTIANPNTSSFMKILRFLNVWDNGVVQIVLLHFEENDLFGFFQSEANISQLSFLRWHIQNFSNPYRKVG